MSLLHGRISAKTFTRLRLWILFVLVLNILTDSFQDMANLPVAFFEPVGFLSLLVRPQFYDALLHPAFLLGFKGLLLAGIIFTAALPERLMPGLLLAVGLTFYQGMLRGFGTVSHAEINLLYAVYFLVFYVWTTANTSSRQGAFSYPASLSLLGLTTAMLMTYSFIGVHRIVASGFEIFTSDSLRFWILRSAGRWQFPFGGEPAFFVYRFAAADALLNAGFAVVTFFEAGALFCLISNIFRRAFLCVMIVFHLLTFLLMGIFFWENLLLFVLLLDWARPRASSGPERVS